MEGTINMVKEYPYIAQSQNARKTFTELIACVNSGTPFGWVGDPGVGKTATIQAVADATGRELINLSLSTLPAEDVAGIPYPSKEKIGEDIEPTAVYAKPWWQRRLLANPHCILFLDEFSTAFPSTQHAFLQIIQDRRLPSSETRFSDDVAIIIAMNPSEQAGGNELGLPIANRMSWYKFEANYDDWAAGFKMGWKSPTKMTVPASIVPEEEHERHDEKIRNIILKYLDSSAGSRQVNVLPSDKDVPVDINASDLSRMEIFRMTFPSGRSWDNLSRILSWIPDTDENLPIINDVIIGTIGSTHGLKFYKFFLDNHNSLDLKAILNDPSTVDWKKLSVNDTEGIFMGLIDLAKSGHFKEVLNVYFEIAHQNAFDLLSGARLNEVWKAENMKGLSREEKLELTNAYKENFGPLMKRASR